MFLWIPILKIDKLNDALEYVFDKAQEDENTAGGGGGEGVVVLCSYEGLRRLRSSLLMVQWTAVCLDEGQKIRNPAAGATIDSTI